MLPDHFRFVAFCVKAREREREKEREKEKGKGEGVASEYVGVVVYGEPQLIDSRRESRVHRLDTAAANGEFRVFVCKYARSFDQVEMVLKPKSMNKEKRTW